MEKTTMEALTSGRDGARRDECRETKALKPVAIERAPETKGTLETKGALETKGEGASALELKDAFEDFMGAFGAFREANDERLAEIERKLTADVLSEEKVTRINDALDSQKRLLDRLVLKGRRPELGAPGGRGVEASEHKAAFDAYVRSGEMSGLRRLEEKALSTATSPDSGYLAPPEVEAEIGRRLSIVSPIRSIAGIRTVSSNVYRKPFATTGFTTGWSGETDARSSPTNTPTLVELEYPVMELYAMPAATQALLDDTAIDIDQWIASEVEMAFAEQEGAAFVLGDADKKPRGFLDYDTVAEGSWVWGKLGFVLSGADAGFVDDETGSDVLVDAIYALKAGYRQNAHWVMNRKTQAEVRKLKDQQGNYLWAPPANADGRATIMNFPVVEAEDMPDLAEDSLSVAFGDFSRGYLIVDRLGVRVLRDPYSSKPYVLFYTTKRVGGGVQDFDAIKLIKFGTA
jgi:HK97 family phage major capsid protein